jgi:hypothetical protein
MGFEFVVDGSEGRRGMPSMNPKTREGGRRKHTLKL